MILNTIPKILRKIKDRYNFFLFIVFMLYKAFQEYVYKKYSAVNVCKRNIHLVKSFRTPFSNYVIFNFKLLISNANFL